MNIRIKTNDTPMYDGDTSRVLLLLPPEDAASAEDYAMIQALYSRDPRPIDDAVKLARTSQSGEFMKKFYVGYGHQSIADCGMITLAIENVPMVIAKLIQHTQLYNGQECSTRYLDFSTQGMTVNPADLKHAQQLRQLYNDNLTVAHEYAAELHDLDMSNPTENKTAKAAAFDILRGILPIGTHTNLSWTTSIRNFHQHMARLKAVNEYLESRTGELYYRTGESYYRKHGDFISFNSQGILGLDEIVAKLNDLVNTEFPNSQAEYKDDRKLIVEFDQFNQTRFNCEYHNGEVHPWSVVRTSGELDFAGWRDLARHRSIKQSFPFDYNTDLHVFYQEHLSNMSTTLLGNIYEIMDDLFDPLALPMGVTVPYHLQGTYDDFEYIVHLRTGHTVHPTVRRIMLDLADQLDIKIPDYRSGSRWSVNTKRASQDIKKV